VEEQDEERRGRVLQQAKGRVEQGKGEEANVELDKAWTLSNECERQFDKLC
jgi:hypothetical protein